MPADVVMSRSDESIEPGFCTLSVLLQAFFWAQLGSLLYVLGQGLPLDWSLAGLVSIYSGWLSVIMVFAWCVISKYAATSLMHKPAWLHAFWTLLWLTGIVLATLLAQLIYQLGSSQYLPLLPPGVEQWSFLLSSAVITAILSGSLLRYLFIQQRWRSQQQQQARAELRNLQARVHPHFLFNTLNTIAALAEEQPEHAVAAIEDLSDLLRQSLAPRDRLISLAEELDLARRYLRLMQWRLGERLQLGWHIEQAICSDPRWRLPPLTLQVLLENAVLHGIQPRRDGGCIDVHASVSAQQLYIRISNPCAGNTQTQTQTQTSPADAGSANEQATVSAAHQGTGTAISDLRRRLQLMFMRTVSLETRIVDNRFEATLCLPAQADVLT
jgi:two-component system, LytTR family, sensor histidine kinase AlgZ